RLDGCSVVVDVGANIGAFAVPLTRDTGARVIAVEPVSSTFALLNDNVRRNRVQNTVTTVRSALGSTAGEAVVTTDSQSANYLLHDRASARAGEEHVGVTTLDALVADEPRIDLIKVDVEGLELEVMRGAQVTLARHAPAVLLELEARWTRRYGYEPRELIAFMMQFGYSYELVTPDGLAAPTTLADDLRRANNLLFTGG
ncbi:MAG: FkbM family methyltransferase, partial [Solirubrobacteraceae bacterium]